MSKDWKDTFRFSLSLQMVGMVVLLILACTLLSRVYATCVEKTRQAEARNQSILLARYAAEVYLLEGGDLTRTQERVDQDRTVPEEVTFTLTESVEETAAGQMRTLHIRAEGLGIVLHEQDVSLFVPADNGTAEGTDTSANSGIFTDTGTAASAGSVAATGTPARIDILAITGTLTDTRRASMASGADWLGRTEL